MTPPRIGRAELADANQRMIELLEVHRREGDASPADAAERWSIAQGFDVEALGQYARHVGAGHIAAAQERGGAVPLEAVISQGIALGWILHSLYGEPT